MTLTAASWGSAEASDERVISSAAAEGKTSMVMRLLKYVAFRKEQDSGTV